MVPYSATGTLTTSAVAAVPSFWNVWRSERSSGSTTEAGAVSRR